MEKIRTTRMTATASSAAHADLPTPASSATSRLADAPEAPSATPDLPPPPSDLSPSQLEERARIIATLAACSYNQKAAAARLSISRGTLFTRMKRYNIPGPRAGSTR
jgi:transcriptional regulator of acetoin/glycerol metabolism